jgi:hypothetical protein
MDEVRSWPIPMLAILLAGALGSCTTVQSRSSASANLDGVEYDEAFRSATQAAMDAGFTIGTADKDAGLITATRGANSLLTFQSPIINITVLDDEDGAAISIASTVGGQMIDYGTTSSTIDDFCAALRTREPTATCSTQ